MVMATDQDHEFRQIGDSWLHVYHDCQVNQIVVTVTNEAYGDVLCARLDKDMSRELVEWICQRMGWFQHLVVVRDC